MTDEQLARSIQQGNSDALAALVEQHYDGLLGYLYRMMGGNRALAEDLAQETFLRAMRRIDSYRYPRPFKPWLYSIATNLARNHYNRAETRRTAVNDDAVDKAVDDAPGMEEAMSQQGDIEQVMALLVRLPEHQREAMVLRYYEEWSLAEIAEALNIPVGTVKSRLSLGLGRLRSMMEEAGA